MKKIIIVRHAKSDWKTGVEDFDRPLNERGNRVAPKMGGALKEQQASPDFVLCSSAKRTRQTAALLLKDLYDLTSITYKQEIYEASFFDLMQVVNNDIPNESKEAMLIGHNPGVSELIEYLTGDGAGWLATCSCVCLSAPIDSWEMATKGVFSIDWNIYPKMFDY